ncbi:hypothetical protein TREMEDRAFT_60829 [Tremella mesenterica DSM 1558]|uniref:uncharacterized protein n=1 Tax=Tremella mesenterica (strain ATCC 24925 / CBS 8224 / DSM 1558 / NBRC 9311 / NRRL Y-6157 / RJB 2259-6 / UBC 559-6) TaxID=578456 RepID=UPI0003F495D2|nr:uncharacterized protein TREMEDRAFT_60829 [Tremella mesenterica DSM 1558]EIW70338.1 hypothetical protein TREMEDRAFT_60829 [Tremella mesenterica DSM 1558]
MSAKPASSETTPVQAAGLEDSVLYQSSGSTRTYRLNRPKKLNSLNQEMITSMYNKVKTWRDSELVQVIIGTGEGRAFCAGGDVAQLIIDLKEGKDTPVKFFKSEFELNWLLGKLKKPYIAVMDGVVMGGGAGISLPASIRIATPNTIFAMPETNIGYSPDVGSHYYLAQLDGQIGAWLAVTGQNVYGRAAYELGIATHYVPSASIAPILHQITHHTGSELNTVTLSRIVSSYHLPSSGSSAPSSKSSPDGPSSIKGDIRVFIDQVFSQSQVKDIYDSIVAAIDSQELSEEVKEWAKEQKEIMDKRSPTGMAVALEGFRRAKQEKKLDKVLLNDFAMATSFSGPKRPTDDFIIGVSQVLLEKDKTKKSLRPSWSPTSISEISQSYVDQFFSQPHKRSSKLSDTPNESDQSELMFDPVPRNHTPDSTWGQFRFLGLPSERELQDRIRGASPSSGAYALTEKELTEQMLDDVGENGGSRQDDFLERIKEVLKRKCKRDDDGNLKWLGKE